MRISLRTFKLNLNQVRIDVKTHNDSYASRKEWEYIQKNVGGMSLANILKFWQEAYTAGHGFYDVLVSIKPKYARKLAWKCVSGTEKVTVDIVSDLSKAYEESKLTFWRSRYFEKNLRCKIVGVLEGENDLDHLFRLWLKHRSCSSGLYFSGFVSNRIKFLFVNKEEEAKEEAEAFKEIVYKYNQSSFFGCEALLDKLEI